MKIKLITIIFICLMGSLIMGILHWYFNYQLAEGTPATNTKETIEMEETAGEGIKSIELEKPPFIK